MKKTLLFPIFLFCFVASFAQNSLYHFAEEFYFVKEISVSSYRDKQFRYEIAIRSNPADTFSRIRIHGIAAGNAKEDFIKSNFAVETRSEEDWTVYTIVGRVHEDAHRLLFYASINGNGDFYFDDVNFYLEHTPGRWKQVELFNPSFEISKPDIFAGYYVSKRRSEGLKVHLSDHIYKTGRSSLNVKTSGNIPVSGIVQQVMNQTPQTEEELNFHLEFADIAPYLMIPRTKKESPETSPLLSKSKTK
jgi:hypothetical protein